MRINSFDQSIDKQLADVEIGKKFIDHCSGNIKKRPQLKECIQWLREGDTLIVDSMDRLASNITHLQELIKEINTKGVSLQFHQENLIFSGEKSSKEKHTGKIIGVLGDFERSRFSERQKEGLATARKKGVKLGAPRMFQGKEAQQIRDKHKKTRNVSALAREYNTTRQTIYRVLKGD